MAFAILGLPRPQFFDSSGSPLASGTVTIQNPSDSAVKASYPTAADADASTNGTSADVSTNARGQPDQDLWGKDNEDYKIIIKNSAGSTQDTFDKIRMPRASRRAAVTFGSTDATPTIAEAELFITAGTTAITDFDDGKVGDIITVLGASSKVVTHNSNISLRGEVSFSMVTGDILTLAMLNDQVWEEIGRTYAKAFAKFKTSDNALTSTTLADDAQLKDWVLQPNTYYRLDGYLHVTADAATRDLEIDITTDNAFVEEMYTWITQDGAGVAIDGEAGTIPLTTAIAQIDIDGTDNVGILLKGYVLTHATSACNVDIQFANQAAAGTTTVKKGSWVAFTPYYE